MSVLQLFAWCDQTALAAALRESTWLFPVIETAHLLALALLGGCILLIDFRLLGIGLCDQPAPRLSRAVRPWLIGSLAVMIGSGVLLFLAEAMKCYASPAFWLKMAFLALAVLYTLTIRRWTVRARAMFRGGPQLVAVVSIALWLAVGITGRGIGFW